MPIFQRQSVILGPWHRPLWDTKTQKRIEAVVNAPRRTNVNLRLLCTFLTKPYFIHCTDYLRRTKYNDEAFMTAKKVITSDDVLTMIQTCRFALRLMPLPMVDALFWAILCPIVKKCQFLASHSLMISVSRKNYSPREEEALEIICGFFVYGRQFCLITDHEPLTSNLLPLFLVHRRGSQRNALFLAGYTIMT